MPRQEIFALLAAQQPPVGLILHAATVGARTTAQEVGLLALQVSGHKDATGIMICKITMSGKILLHFAHSDCFVGFCAAVELQLIRAGVVRLSGRGGASQVVINGLASSDTVISSTLYVSAKVS